MGDNESVSSDWESVRDEDAPQWGAGRIVLELPSGGLRDSGVVEVEAPAFAADGSHSVAGSSLSSFVPVSRFDKMSVQPKFEKIALDGNGSNNSVAGSSISSFAHASQFDSISKQPKGGTSFTAGSAISSYQYKSEASVQASDDESLLGNFEVLSLSSGEVVLRCKRCTFHNKPGADVCAACQLALVANPNIDVDAQIATHLLKKEEQNRTTICQNPFYDHACILTQDINDCVKGNCVQDGRLLCTLPKDDLQRLVSGFIEQVVDFPDPKRILLALKCTSHGGLEGVRASGFSADQPFMDPRQVELSHNLNNAIDSFEMLQMMRGEPLGAIPENPDDGAEDLRIPSCLCWIVAIVLGTTDDCDENMNTCWPPERTFPVAYFESSCKNSRGGLSAMLQLLNDTVVDKYFARNLNPQLPRRRPPSQTSPLSNPVQFSKEWKPWESIMTDVQKQVEEEKEARARNAERKSPTGHKGNKNANDDTDHDTVMGGDEYNSFSWEEECLAEPKNDEKNEAEPEDLHVEGKPFTWVGEDVPEDNINEGNLSLEQELEDLERELGTSTANSPIADNNDEAMEHEQKEVKAVQIHGHVSALAPFRDGLVCCSGGDIYLLDEKLVVYRTLKNNEGGDISCITSASFGERHLIASGTGKGIIFVHDYEKTEGSHTCRFDTGNGGWCVSILNVRFLPKGTSVAAVNRHRECFLYNITNKTCLIKLRGERTAPPEQSLEPCLLASEFSPDGYRLASVIGGSDFIHFWRLNNGKTQQLTGHESGEDTIGRRGFWIGALSFSPCGKFLASSANDCTIRIWEDNQKDYVCCVKVINVPVALNSLAFSPDSTLIAGGCINGMVQVWNFCPDNRGSAVRTNFSNKGSLGSVKLVTFLPDSKSLVSTGWTTASFRHWPVIDVAPSGTDMGT